MLIFQRPLVTKFRQTTCDFHKRNPGKPFAGCGCTVSVTSREKTWEEMTDEEREQEVRMLATEEWLRSKEALR